jgi:hypothetical protein
LTIGEVVPDEFVSDDIEVDILLLAPVVEMPDALFLDLGGGIIEFDMDVLPLALFTPMYFLSLAL